MKKVFLVFRTHPEVIEKDDFITFLLTYKESKNLNIETTLDFCGVIK